MPEKSSNKMKIFDVLIYIELGSKKLKDLKLLCPLGLKIMNVKVERALCEE
ncbi:MULTISPECIES: hypothetical protein [Chryseobacterium]|uniref:hypothetical protein n=1 Tax=Chryseobacterium indologenes TaxID=253 RepID=UPI004059F0E0